MRDTLTCTRLRASFPAWLWQRHTRAEQEKVHAHLRACPSCRTELGQYFTLDRWEDGGRAEDWTGADFTAAVMAALARVEEGADRVRRRAVLRRKLILDYLAAACATLILLMTNFFGIFTDLAARADRFSESARRLNRETYRLADFCPDWRAIWQKLTAAGGRPRTNQEE